MRLGVTGSMGSGKTTVVGFLQQLGYRCLDSDRIIREEVLHEPAVITAIADRFGDGVLTAAGGVDRRAVATVVFQEDAQREWLERLVHPRLYARWRAVFTAEPDADWVVEVPLLFEQQLENWFDFTVCVASSLGLQLARLEKRGIPHALAEQRISKQLPLALKLELADFVLWNDGSPDFLREQLGQLQARVNAGTRV